MVKSRALHIILVLALLAGAQALRADERIAGAVVAITVGPRSEGSDTVRRVIASSIEVHLRQVGLMPIDGESWEQAEAQQEVVERWEGSDVDFLLLARLTAAEPAIDVELSLYLNETRQLLARVRSTEPVGLTLDRAIAGLVANLIEQSRPYIQAAADERRARIAELHAEEPHPAEDAHPAEEAPPAADEHPVDVVEAVSPAEPAAKGPAAFVPDSHFMEISSRYAPFVPVGAAARYIGLGPGVGLTLNFFPFRTDWFGVGLAGRGVLAQAAGAAATADLMLGSAGVSLLFSATEGRVLPYLGVVGGASYFRATNESLGTFETVVPYAEAGLGIQVRLFGPFRLDVVVGIEGYLADSLLLLGFAPGIGLSLRL